LKIRLTQAILLPPLLIWEWEIIRSTWSEFVEISGTWKWPVVLHSEVGTAAIIYSSFNKQSKFRPSLHSVNRSESTTATPSPSSRQSSALSSPLLLTEVKSLEIDLLYSFSPTHNIWFVCFNSTARFDNSLSYIKRIRGVAASKL